MIRDCSGKAEFGLVQKKTQRDTLIGMNNFYPNQRYTSSGEPELGIGLVTEVSKGKVEIYFPSADTTRLYAMESAPLNRVVFKPGETISDVRQNSIVIERVELEDQLYMYYGKNERISEAILGDVAVNHGVEDKLLMGDVDSPSAFALRRETLYHEYQRSLSPVNGFVGGRIDLIPHQLYIAHEVSSRYAPRVLLSDQVGLGKTIEACLILHRLLLSGQASRVLILVPDSLVHQWFVEVLRRFNMWFNIFDEERCASLDEGAPDGNPFYDNQLILCSIEFLAGSPKRMQQAASANWDMLVVDEAHNLEWSITEASKEYRIVEALSQIAKGLLLLTATPEQLGVENHFARLRLLDPSRYANFDDFVNESNDQKDIANIVEKLYEGTALLDQDLKMLSEIFPKERITALAKSGDSARHQLIEDLLDQHGPGRVLFRNTRAAMSGFPKRIAHLTYLEVSDNSDESIKLLNNEFKSDMGLNEKQTKQRFKFENDPRALWVRSKLDETHPTKILLICKSKEKVLALEKALTEDGTIKAAVFHEDLTIVQRDRNAAWFSESDGAQILLCSEIGSEGRNFQFAHHLVLFDLPLHPDLLEQRIGRLDRIGQTKDIHLHIPLVKDSPQETLASWYHKGLNAFERNLEGGNEISKLFSTRLLTICEKQFTENAASDLNALIDETATFHKELLQRLASGRDRLLEMNSFRPEVAERLIKQIEKEDHDKSLEIYFTKVFKHFEVEMEDLAARSYFLHPTAMSTEVFPSITGDGVAVTFDRKRALSREDFRFLSWEHPMTTDAIDMVLSSGLGSTSYGVLRGTNRPGLLLEVLFVMETTKEPSVNTDRFLPKTPIRIVVDHTGNEVTDEYQAETINKSIIPGQIDPLLDNEAFAEIMFPNMISAAEHIAEDQHKKKVEQGLDRMNQTLNHEISRLKTLQKRNKNVRSEEIEIAQKEQHTLNKLINETRIRIDAMQFIKKE